MWQYKLQHPLTPKKMVVMKENIKDAMRYHDKLYISSCNILCRYATYCIIRTEIMYRTDLNLYRFLNQI